MSVFWQIPRNCLAWILIAQLALIVPHVQRLPWWVLLTFAAASLWRVMVYQGRWSFPPRSAKVLFSILCFVGIWISYGTLMGLEPTVALLIAGFCLKLLELDKKRDVYVIIYLGFFVALTAFLFSQDFLIAVYMLATVLLLSTAQVALHQHGYDRFSLISLKKAALMLLQALPIMLVLFVVFPRFDPLWKVPLPSHQATTGIADTLSPGDISTLSQSGDLAFRVLFDDAIPRRQAMYWRGLVMSEFDGRRWSQGSWAKRLMSVEESDRVLQQQNNPLRYTVIQEPTYQPWLFTLALAYSQDQATAIASDYRLVYRGDITTRIKYPVLSTPAARFELTLTDRSRELETRLPAAGNPQSRAMARRLYAESANGRDYIDRILKTFSAEDFYYTLNPPRLGEQSIDEFLLTTRRGFCGHYASSLVFLMRSVGIPARVITGYQGGEINPITGTVLVHQFDAHAWAEVWLAGEGWTRVDPTAAVAHHRIEYGLERAMAEEGSFLAQTPLSPLRYRNVQWLNQIRLQLDAFNYYWTSWVLQYRDDRQLKVLQALLGRVTPWRLAIFILAIGGIVLMLVAYQLLKGRGQAAPSAEVKAYLRLCQRLEKAGYKRLPCEGASDFARRVAGQEPRWQVHLLAATRAFVRLSYEPLAPGQQQAVLKLLRREVAQLSAQLGKKT